MDIYIYFSAPKNNKKVFAIMKPKFSLRQFGVSASYSRIQKLGDRLEPIAHLLDWEAFRKILQPTQKTVEVGRPSYDPVLMLKMLVLQSWYGVSDEELEYWVADRISFQKFLGFPDRIPDYTTVWRFRESLAREGVLDAVWTELKRQMTSKGVKFSKGVIQDATFVTAPPGKTNSGMKDRGRGQPTTRNEDGTWAKKGGKAYFGYKTHAKTDAENGIITELAVTTASTHDSNIDLTTPDEVCYRDKGYFGAKPKAIGDGTMRKAVRNRKLTIREKLRNRRIMRRRAPGERPFAVMKRVMKGGHTMLTELHRVFAQQLVCCFTYNLIRMNRIMRVLT